MQKIKFRFKEDHVDSFAELGDLKAVFIDLTNRCNLRCRYCFNYHALQESPRHLDPGIIEQVLHAKRAGSVKNWFLSGGEPVLYRHLSEVLALFRGEGARPKIATNGTKLTPEIIDSWIGYGVPSVQISLDTLDAGRHAYLNGGRKHDHAAVLRNIDYAVGSPLRVVVSSVLTEVNKREIKEIMAFCFESGVNSYTLYPNVPSDTRQKDLIVPFPELLELMDELFAAYNSLSPARIIDITIPCFSDSAVYEKWKDLVAFRLHYCAAAQVALKITCEGMVSACICQDKDPFIIGDLRRDSLDDIWVSDKAREFRSLYTRIPECRLCSRSGVCRGGCRNNAFLFGSKGIYSLDPYCRYFKSLEE